MANLDAKKSDYLSAVVTFAEALMGLTREAEELAAYQAANQFQAGGANAITDADATGPNPNAPSGNAHLDAATANAVVTIAGQLGGAVTATMRNTLRRAGRRPNP